MVSYLFEAKMNIADQCILWWVKAW